MFPTAQSRLEYSYSPLVTWIRHSLLYVCSIMPGVNKFLILLLLLLLLIMVTLELEDHTLNGGSFDVF